MLGSGFDGGEGGQVAFEECDFGIGDCGFDGLDQGRGGLRVAAAEVDVRGVVLCEREDGFVSDARGAWGWELVVRVRYAGEQGGGGVADRL